MIYVFLSFGLFVFVLAFHFLKIVPVARDSFAVSRKAFDTVRSNVLSDEEKEATSRQAAARLFGGFFSILGRSVAALAVSLLPILFGASIGLFTTGEAAAAATNGYFIGGSLLLVLPMIAVFR
jgi:hypothetical protein